MASEKETPTILPRKLVVAAIIVDGERVLISQRKAGQALANKWEFPGGKIEAGESPESALVREIQEELAVEIEVGKIWELLYHRYPEFELFMPLYICRLKAGQEVRKVEVADFAWVQPKEMDEFDILEADSPLVRRMQAEGLPAWEK